MKKTREVLRKVINMLDEGMAQHPVDFKVIHIARDELIAEHDRLVEEED